MDSTIPVHPHHRPAATLEKGMRIAPHFLPLRSAAEVLFAYPYLLHGEPRVLVVVLYDGDGQPQPDDFLAHALIPVTSMPVKAGCVFHTSGPLAGSLAVECADYPLCVCTPPVRPSSVCVPGCETRFQDNPRIHRHVSPCPWAARNAELGILP
jgi:hypothetical protein